MHSIHKRLALGLLAATLASTAKAVTTITLTENSGWHYGESHSKNSTQMFRFDGSGGQFTLRANVTHPLDILSFVDGYSTGDVYSLSIKAGGTATFKTQFLGGASFDYIPKLSSGPFGSPFGADWSKASYGHGQAELSRGLYTITVKDLCGSGRNPACPGFPAGWGVRLDAAVPEPSTWGLMLVGFFGLGAALRRRRLHGTA